MNFNYKIIGLLLLSLLLVLGVGLAESPVSPDHLIDEGAQTGTGLASAPPLNVILISWDGVQRAHLSELRGQGLLPNLAALAEEGAAMPMEVTGHATDTKAGHAQILTGYRPDITDAGEQQVDFSPELAGQVQVTDGQGRTQIVDASAFTVTEALLFVEPAAQAVTQMAQAPTALRTPHAVERLEDGHTLITDGGRPRVGEGSRIIEVDQQGNIVWSFDQGLNWAHSAERLPDGHTLISDTGHNRVIEVDADGRIVWNSDEVALSDGSHLRYPNDADWLEDDHLLITDRDNHRVIETDRQGQVLWQFGVTGVPDDDDKHLKHPHNADRLANGNTIITDSENGRILEVSPDGAVVWEYWPTGPETLHWPRDADRLENGHTLITDSRNGRVIEVAPEGGIVWEYAGLDLPYEADRLSNGNTLISAAPGGVIIEVDPAGTVVWQYPPLSTSTGTIAGTVRDVAGQPLSGVTVTVFGTDYSSLTDVNGHYTISGVPAAAPRYILTAEKDDYRTAQAGGIDVQAGTVTTVDLILQAGESVNQTLHVMLGYLVRRDPSGEKLVPPPEAVLDPTLYPDEVLPYLEPGEYIESGDPAIVTVAQSILASLSLEERTQQATVAHAVYAWMVQNIEYDLMRNYPDDVTSGNWQTTYGAWGHSFAEWLYTAREVLEEARGICIEHARLATALLRAVGIPARPAPLMAHPVTQWWVQLPDGSGFWANMDTSKGRSAYTRSGDLWANFPSVEEHVLGFWAVDADAPIHMDWWTENPTLWREDYGGGRRFPATAEGLAQARAALAYFAETGELPPPSGPPPAKGQPYYEVSIRGFIIDLTNMGEQTHFEVGFPLAIETEYVKPIDQAHWTNHPDWVTETWLETESDPRTGESLTFYRIALDRNTAEPARYLLISYNANYLWGPPVHVQRADPRGFVSTLNRHLELMDHLGIKADYYFTGLAAERLAEWSPETVERLLGSDHGINYHGANRPPYPQLIDLVQGENWEEDVATVRIYEVEGRNMATGEYVGGIAAFRDAFGQEPFATGRFFEASILYVDKELGARMGVGLRGNTGAGRNDAWFLGVLNRPEQAGLPASGLARAAIRGEDGEYLAHARAILTSVDGPFPVVAFPIHDHDFYSHTPADQEKIWTLYEKALRLALEMGYQPVTLREVYALVRNGPAPTISQDELLQAAQSLVQTLESTGYPPEYVAVDGIPYSLAEIFEALARALAAYRETGSLPEVIETHDILGPTELFTSDVLHMTVSADVVLDAAVAVSDALIDWIPSQVTIGDYRVNPAEFLYLMAQEYVALRESGPTLVALQAMSLLPLSVIQNEEADPLTKPQFWTYKSAVFALR